MWGWSNLFLVGKRFIEDYTESDRYTQYAWNSAIRLLLILHSFITKLNRKNYREMILSYANMMGIVDPYFVKSVNF